MENCQFYENPLSFQCWFLWEEIEFPRAIGDELIRYQFFAVANLLHLQFYSSWDEMKDTQTLTVQNVKSVRAWHGYYSRLLTEFNHEFVINQPTVCIQVDKLVLCRLKEKSAKIGTLREFC